VVVERPVNRGRCDESYIGDIRIANAGKSNDKQYENYCRRKPYEVSSARIIRWRLVGPLATRIKL